MKKAFVWTKIFLKRQIKRPSVIFMLLFMLLLGSCLGLLGKNADVSINVGIYVPEAHNSRNVIIKDRLTRDFSNHRGILSFKIYESKDNLVNDVRSGKTVCGYAYSDDFFHMYTSGTTDSLIDAITTPDDTVTYLANVVVLSITMKSCSDFILLDDTLNQSVFSGLSTEELNKTFEYYNRYINDGSTFNFDYRTMYEELGSLNKNVDISSFIITPVRGIMAIFIFIMALSGGSLWYTDRDSHIFYSLTAKSKVAISILDIGIPVLLTDLMCFFIISVCSYFNGLFDNLCREILVIVLYSIFTIIYVFLLCLIIRKKSIYVSLIPLLALGSFICCPVFFNLAGIFPGMEIIQYLFVPTYYFML